MISEVDGFTNISTYIPPSQRHLSRHRIDKEIGRYMQKYRISSRHRAVLDLAIKQEKPGFFGYHGAKQDFRIYQDIVRYVFEEVLQIPIRKDFHFMRAPGHPDLNVNSAKEFLKKHPLDINDGGKAESSQLLSMNMALYENYWDPHQFTVHFFSKNNNWKKYDFKKKLIPFFQVLGIDPSSIDKAFAIAHSKLPSTGVLYQIFDTSGRYRLADRHTYLSKSNGKKYLPQKPVSALLTDMGRTCFPQIRMIMNNRVTLNPSAPISIQRYDLTPPDVEALYDAEMRTLFRSLEVDKAKKEAYVEKMTAVWNRSAGRRLAA